MCVNETHAVTIEALVKIAHQVSENLENWGGGKSPLCGALSGHIVIGIMHLFIALLCANIGV